MDRRTYWATKNPQPQFEAVEFTHPAFAAEPLRLVANVYAEVTLGGNVHLPAPMTISPPRVGPGETPSMSIAFPRAVLGVAFKRLLARVKAWPTPAPIEVTYAVYCADTAAPEVTWNLYVGDQDGVSFSASVVSVSAVDNNPMLRRAGPIYDPAVFTGLVLI